MTAPLDFWKLIAATQPLGRLSLVGSPGLLNTKNQVWAEQIHQAQVFQRHGLSEEEVSLMGAAWCVRLVNARRAIERAISEKLVSTAYQLRQAGFMTNLAFPVALPPLPPRMP